MPLIKSGSKHALKQNIETEMKSNPDQKDRKQNLAIAFDIQRKNKRKKMMAEGGSVNESAASEHRPMPEERDKDSQMVSRNSSKKAITEGDWTDKPTERQASNSGKMKISHKAGPDMVRSSAFTARIMKPGDHIMEEMQPDGYGKQPKRDYDEDGADRKGPDVPDMQDEHSNHRKPYANGGTVSFDEAEEDHVEHPAALESDDDQMSPPEEEYMASHFAEGGSVDEEEMAEHHASIAAAIMAKKAAKDMLDSGSDIDHQMHESDEFDDEHLYAEGGEIHSHDSIYSDDSSEVDLSRNSDEDANEEDQLSYNALRKENYSESEGLKKLTQPKDSNEHGDDMLERSKGDKHDRIDSMRRKVMAKRR